MKKLSKKAKRLIGICAGAISALMLSTVGVFASADVTPATYDDFKPVMDVLTKQFNLTTVVAVVASILAVVVGMVFFWKFGRKALSSLMAALKGKLKV